jgi:NitT/TauT family transport system substrate-binding protein
MAAASIRAIFSVLLGAAALAAAGGPAAAQDKVWRHGILNPKSDAGILAMVGSGDFGKQQGLKIELVNFKYDQIGLKALIAGEVDSFEGGPQGVFSAASKGGDARILGCHWTVVPHGIYAKDTIKDVKDLKGKQIAVSAPNSMPDMLARSALEKSGINPSDVKLAAVGGDRERYQALIAGVVEAAVVSNEYEPVAPKNVHLLLAGRDALPNFLRICIFSSAAKLKARGDDAVKFLVAEMNALKYALSNKQATIDLAHKLTQEKPDDPRAAFIFDDAVAHHAVDPTLPLPKDKLQWVEEQLVKAGKIAKPIPVDQVIAPEFREKALKLSGRS